jgi:hypothetical protein
MQQRAAESAVGRVENGADLVPVVALQEPAPVQVGDPGGFEVAEQDGVVDVPVGVQLAPLDRDGEDDGILGQQVVRRRIGWHH